MTIVYFFVQFLLSFIFLCSSIYIEMNNTGVSFFASHLLNLHFAIKVSAAEVMTELPIIKSVPVRS